MGKVKNAARLVSASKTYGQGDAMVVALDKISISFNSGKFTAIMGPSGSGKSTLLQCLAGLDWLTGGRAYIGGTNISELNDKKLTILRREKVGFVFQSFNLMPTLTVGENIDLPLSIAGKKPDPAWRDEIITTLGIKDREKHTPAELSGGQKQRTAVARALITKPDVIFADEPSGNLDSKSGRELLELFRRSVDELGQSVIMVTHDPLAASYADEVVFLDDGKIVDSVVKPTTEKILDKIKKLEKK